MCKKIIHTRLKWVKNCCKRERASSMVILHREREIQVIDQLISELLSHCTAITTQWGDMSFVNFYSLFFFLLLCNFGHNRIFILIFLSISDVTCVTFHFDCWNQKSIKSRFKDWLKMIFRTSPTRRGDRLKIFDEFSRNFVLLQHVFHHVLSLLCNAPLFCIALSMLILFFYVLMKAKKKFLDPQPPGIPILAY